MKSYCVCPNCGNNVLKRNNKYCDQKCKDEFVIKQSDQRYFEGVVRHPKTLKTAYLRHNPETCILCKIGHEWNGKPLVLQLDHIDGNSDNNMPSNLQLLCPNCHTQTETFGSKQTIAAGKPKQTKRKSYLQQYKSRS